MVGHHGTQETCSWRKPSWIPWLTHQRPALGVWAVDYTHLIGLCGGSYTRMGNIHTMVCECNAFCHKTTSHVSISAGGSSDVWGRMRSSLLTSYGQMRHPSAEVG